MRCCLSGFSESHRESHANLVRERKINKLLSQQIEILKHNNITTEIDNEK